jgi:FHA domain
MTNQPPYGVAEIYSEYISRRQGGDPVDDVIRELQPLADRLSKGERKQLGQLIQGWEARNGANYKPISRLAATDSQPQASTESSSRIRRLGPAAEKPSVIRPIEPVGPAGDPDQRQICPHCGKPNHKNDSYCFACGHILITTKSGTKALDDKDMDPQVRWGTAHFGQNSVVLLMVRGAIRPLEVAPKAEMIIGRAAEKSAMMPDIDLTPFNAENLGVSRLHAALKRMENTVAIVDLDSINHTFINGQRLHPHEVRVLRDGDEIRLGKLSMKVAFKHQLRRLSS